VVSGDPTYPGVDKHSLATFKLVASEPIDTPNRFVQCDFCKFGVQLGMLKKEFTEDLNKKYPPNEVCARCYAHWLVSRFGGPEGECSVCHLPAERRFRPNSWIKRNDWGNIWVCLNCWDLQTRTSGPVDHRKRFAPIVVS